MRAVWKCGYLVMDEDSRWRLVVEWMDSGMEFAQERAYKPLNNDY
jgi:hypothetical protein